MFEAPQKLQFQRIAAIGHAGGFPSNPHLQSSSLYNQVQNVLNENRLLPETLSKNINGHHLNTVAACNVDNAVLCLVTHQCPTLCDPMDCSPPGSSVHGDSPGKNTGVGCHALLQGIFPTQGSNPHLLHCRRILYRLSLQGSPFSLQSANQLQNIILSVTKQPF